MPCMPHPLCCRGTDGRALKMNDGLVDEGGRFLLQVIMGPARGEGGDDMRLAAARTEAQLRWAGQGVGPPRVGPPRACLWPSAVPG